MYSDSDLDSAVAAGALSPDAATRLRAYMDSRAASSPVDEEHFRLITGFNDIFVAIAAAILLFAVGWRIVDRALIDRRRAVARSRRCPRRAPVLGPGRILHQESRWPAQLFFCSPSPRSVRDRLRPWPPSARQPSRHDWRWRSSSPLAAASGRATWLALARFRVPITVAAGARTSSVA